MPPRITRILPHLARAMAVRLAPGLLLLVLLAGCQGISHPFGTDRTAFPVAAPAALAEIVGPSVMVAPLAGPPADIARSYADQVAAALKRGDVLASTRNPPRQSHLLSGHAYVTELSGVSAVHIVWRLSDPRGMPAGTTELDAALPGTAAPLSLAALPDEVREALARRTADWVAERLYGSAVAASETASPEGMLWARAAAAPPLPPLAASADGPVPAIAALLQEARGRPVMGSAADPFASAGQARMAARASPPLPVPKPHDRMPDDARAAEKSGKGLVFARQRAESAPMP